MLACNPARPPSRQNVLKGLWFPEPRKRIAPPNVFDEGVDDLQSLLVGQLANTGSLPTPHQSSEASCRAGGPLYISLGQPAGVGRLNGTKQARSVGGTPQKMQSLHQALVFPLRDQNDRTCERSGASHEAGPDCRIPHPCTWQGESEARCMTRDSLGPPNLVRIVI